MFADVIFPLKIKPFTYKVPSDMPSDLIGRIVKALLGNRILYGIVADIRDVSNFEGNIKKERIKEIISAHQHFGSPNTVALLKWLSEYYISPAGVALNSCFFKEVVSLIDKSIVPAPTIHYNDNENIKIPKGSDNISILIDAIEGSIFSSFLLHSPSHLYEKAFLNNLFKTASSLISGAIILVPEINMIDSVAKILQSIFGKRVCTIHSKQGKKKRAEIIRGILSEDYNIIIGTRSAILMPLKKISFIAVISEHSPSYKAEEGLRYNGRDVAVRRGFLEKVPVLLSSICPSLESFYNSKTKKYHIIKPTEISSEMHLNSFNIFSSKKRPEIEIVSIWDAYKYGGSISKTILSAAKKYLANNESLLFIVNKKGYSHILCKDCGYIFRCPACQNLLMLYKSEGILKCHSCRYNKKIPDSCQVCNGIELIQLGLGIERVKDDIEHFLKKEPIQFDKNNQFFSNHGQFMSLAVGHSYQIRRLQDKIFKAAVFCDIDLSLLAHDYRANERVFQDVMEVAQMVAPDGRIYLQTKDTKNKILNYIKNYDFKRFYNNELSIRQETGFSPFKRLILFDIFLKQNDNVSKHKIERLFSQKIDEDIEILGPIQPLSSIKNNLYSLRFLIRSKDRKKLNQFSHLLKEKISRLQGVKVITDVDPMRF